MVVRDGLPQLVSAGKVAGIPTCDPAPGCINSGGYGVVTTCSCWRYPSLYTLRFVALYSSSTATTFPFTSEAQPAVGSNRHDVLVAWLSGPQDVGGNVVAARIPPSLLNRFSEESAQPLTIGTFGPDAGPTRPDVATDGERYVVVWRTKTTAGDYDVAGASIDRSGMVTPLVIASSFADERDPSVIALGNGTFLV